MADAPLIRRAALRLLAASAVLALAACGRKGAPLPPYDVDPCYPRHYPMDESAKQACTQKEIYAREHPPQPPVEGEKGKRRREAAPAAPPTPQSAPSEAPAKPQ